MNALPWYHDEPADRRSRRQPKRSTTVSERLLSRFGDAQPFGGSDFTAMAEAASAAWTECGTRR